MDVKVQGERFLCTVRADAAVAGMKGQVVEQLRPGKAVLASDEVDFEFLVSLPIGRFTVRLTSVGPVVHCTADIDCVHGHSLHLDIVNETMWAFNSDGLSWWPEQGSRIGLPRDDSLTLQVRLLQKMHALEWLAESHQLFFVFAQGDKEWRVSCFLTLSPV
jgi:hypothetical protein